MLQLAESVPQPKIVSLYAPVEDGEPLPINQFRRGVDFIRQQKALGNAILVACGAGISRSTTFALAALKEEENLTLWTALQEIHAKHPYAMPHMALWQSLCDYYSEGVPFTRVMDLVS
jgi:protein-tyrosine phosphatase